MSKLKNVVNYVKYLIENSEDNYTWDDIKDGDSLHAYNLEDAVSSIDAIKVVDQQGGEGEGDYIHYIFSVQHPTYGEVRLKVSGHYDSWSGTEWSYGELSLCEPKPVQVIKYVNVADVADAEITYEPRKYLDFSSPDIRTWFNGILKTSKVTLEFTKVDGEQRVMTCTLNPELIPPTKDESSVKSNRAESTTAFRVYDLDKGDWRSIRWNFVNKMHIEV